MSGFAVGVLNQFEGVLGNLESSEPILGVLLGNGFRPTQWTNEVQLTSITANLPSTQSIGSAGPGQIVSHNISFGNKIIGSGSTTIPGATTPAAAPSLQPVTYFFDAILHTDHFQEARTTDHPIQSGASLSDHMYLLPARLSLEIGMSDALDSYQAGQFTEYSTKSISAYQVLLYLQSLRTPLTVTTRLNVYENMVIESIRAPDDVRTLYGLRATVHFRQIFVGQVQVTTQSGRPNANVTTNPGATQPQAVDQSLLPYLDAASGQWSSNQRAASAAAAITAP